MLKSEEAEVSRRAPHHSPGADRGAVAVGCALARSLGFPPSLLRRGEESASTPLAGRLTPE